jgi:hypothetical protein
MRHPTPILIALFVAGFAALAPAVRGGSVIIVKSTGAAPANNEETITITSIIPNPTPPPAKIPSFENIKFSVTAADVANANAKSKAVATAINAQSANVTATDKGGSLSIDAKAGNTLTGLSFSPTTTVAGKQISTGEVLRLNPINLNKGGFVAYNLNLQGTALGGGLATLDLGDPTTGMNLLATVSTTAGMTDSMIVADLATEINAFSTSLFATASGENLAITGALDQGNDNNYIDFELTDNGFSFTYGVSAVPEPSTAVLLGIGALLLSGYVQRTRRRA